MAFQEPSYDTLTQPVSTLPEVDRATFVTRVYQHVALAIAAFVAFEVVLFVTGVAASLREFFFGVGGGGGRWLIMLGGVMVGQMFANNMARDLTNPSRQYFGLFGTAALEALIFAPFLSYIFARPGGGATVLEAMVITAVGFAALTAIGMFTKKDLSWMRPMLMWGGVVALLLIVGAVVFGFGLGTWFSVAMIGFAGGLILYQTQNIMRRYPKQAHVPAAIALFSSLMTMFWYVLRLVMSRD